MGYVLQPPTPVPGAAVSAQRVQWPLLLGLTASLLPACSGDTGRAVTQEPDARIADADGPAAATLPVNSACKDNAQCATGLCWYGICSLKNPRTEGGSCFGKGECRSANCLGGSCIPGTRKDGSACRFGEECVSQRCESGKCKTKVSKPDNMVCTFETFCKMLKPGYACCCWDESNWHPCCPEKCGAAVVHACEATTGKCLDFCSTCLPPGWVPTKK